MADLFGLARMTVSSSGTGAITLNSAVTGFATFDTAYQATRGSTVPPGGIAVQYAINDTTQSEQGNGVYTSSDVKLTRGSSANKSVVTSISTAQTTPINMSNAAQVFITPMPQYYNTLTGKNKIINGEMRFNQRGAATATSTAYNGYWLDRFSLYTNGGGVYTTQRSTVAPAGFSWSQLLTVTTADAAIAAGDYYFLNHSIEGSNCLNLNWGGSNAATITLSFWVRSSIAGAYGGALRNSANNRSYPFQYTVNTADTFEYKSVTIAGDTSGTWLVSNAAGVMIDWDLGSGSTFTGTANSWSGNNYVNSTGSTAWIATNGATFYITGIQFEVGPVATSYESIPYPAELELCQRYYEKSLSIDTVPGTAAGAGSASFVCSWVTNTTSIQSYVMYQVRKRSDTPTRTTYDGAGTAGSVSALNVGVAWVNGAAPLFVAANGRSFAVYMSTAYGAINFDWTSADEI